MWGEPEWAPLWCEEQCISLKTHTYVCATTDFHQLGHGALNIIEIEMQEI